MSERKPSSVAAESDEDLIARFRIGRSAADFEQLVTRHQHSAFRIAIAICGKQDLAEEVVQEAFITAIRRCARFEGKGPGTFRAWFFAIVHNVSRGCLRTERRAINRERNEVYQREAFAMITSRENEANDSDQVKCEDLSVLQSALSSLAEDLRLPIILYYIEGLSQNEISVLSGVHASQISRRITKGLELLRKQLAIAGVGASALILPRLLGSPQLIRAPESLQRFLTSEGYIKSALSAADQSTRTTVRHSTRTAAAKGTAGGSAAIIAAAGVFTLAATLFVTMSGTLSGSPSSLPAASGNITPLPLPTPSPAPRKPSPVLGRWSFREKPADASLREFKGTWTWTRLPGGGGVMKVPSGQLTAVQVPVDAPRQPFVLSFKHVGNGLNGSVYLAASWSKGNSLLRGETWGRRISGEAFQTAEVYFAGSYAMVCVDGQLLSVRKVECPYPTSNVVFWLMNVQISEIEMRLVEKDFLPKGFENPAALTSSMEKDQQSTISNELDQL